MEIDSPVENPVGSAYDGAFTCPRCGAIYGSEVELADHERSHVTPTYSAEYVCTACGAAFDTEAELNEHGKTHMPLTA